MLRSCLGVVLASVLALASTGCAETGGAIAGAMLNGLFGGRVSSSAPAVRAGEHCQYGERHGWKCYDASGEVPTNTVAAAKVQTRAVSHEKDPSAPMYAPE